MVLELLAVMEDFIALRCIVGILILRCTTSRIGLSSSHLLLVLLLLTF